MGEITIVLTEQEAQIADLGISRIACLECPFDRKGGCIGVCHKARLKIRAALKAGEGGSGE